MRRAICASEVETCVKNYFDMYMSYKIRFLFILVRCRLELFMIRNFNFSEMSVQLMSKRKTSFQKLKTGLLTLFSVWLRDLGSNQDKRLQRPLSYH